MSVLQTIREAKGGQIVTSLSAAAGLSLQDTLDCLDVLVPELAGRFRETTADDPDEYDRLMVIVADSTLEDYLDSARFALGRSAVRDGEEILEHLYGSLDSARERARKIGAPNDVDGELFAQMMTFAATLTLAALSRRNRQALFAATGSDGGGGMVSAILAALLRGLLDGLMRAMRPRGRRRRPYSRKRRARRRTTRSRSRSRKKTATLDDLIGDLLK